MNAGAIKLRSVLLLALPGIGLLGNGGWIQAKAWLAQRLIERSWLQARNGVIAPRPWPWADTTAIARLALPRIGTHRLILEGASGRNLAFAPTHDAASVLPGELGNSIIAGHRDTHFAFLQEVAVGDSLEVERVDGQHFSFRVTSTRIVHVDKARILLDADQPMLTLVTCYPFNALLPGGPLRFIVVAELRDRSAGLQAYAPRAD
ncbi:MAG: class GN sortase [Steroidobacteraceae bacterium]